MLREPRRLAELTRHPIDRFPALRPAETLDVIMRSRQAVEQFGLAVDQHVDTVEIMARYQFMQLSGRISDNARLKPERHAARGTRTEPPKIVYHPPPSTPLGLYGVM
jgi:hypothetical protein